MKLKERNSRKARIEMIPLIDVIFLLLVTFIFFTMSMTINKSMSVQLPNSDTAKAARKDYVNIAVKGDGSLYVDRERVTIEELKVRLMALRARSSQARVLISGDKKASYDDIISVMDTVRKSGISGVSLETR